LKNKNILGKFKEEKKTVNFVFKQFENRTQKYQLSIECKVKMRGK